MSRPFLGVLLALSAVASADPVGSIGGIVVDASTRSPLAGASVIVLNTELGAATDPEGRFLVTGVPAGTYSVEASMIGYQTQVKTIVVVNPARTTELSFRLAQSRIELAEVKVKAEYFPRVKDAPVSERNFSAEEIEVAPGGLGDIQRVVQALPAVVSSGDQDNEVIVRGGNPNENLFLIDGIDVPFPNHFGSFASQGGPVNMLNPLLVREVDFVAGAFPARYGTRTSSVMDISLKRGARTGLDGSIDLGMAGAGLVLEGPLPGPGASFIGSYHKSFLELMAKTGVWGMSAVPYYDNALGKLTFQLGRANELSLLGIWGGDFIHIRPEEDVVKNRYSARQRTDRYAGGISLQTLFGEQGFGRLLISGSDARWQGFAYRDTIETDTLQTNNTSDGYLGLRYDGTLRWPSSHETQAGIGANRVRFNYDLYSRPDTIWRYQYDSLGNPVESTVVNVSQFSARAQARSNRAFAYVQHRVLLGNFGSLSLGGRLDWFEYTGQLDLAPRLGFSTRPLLAGL
ncbi:MAG: TonB-dependent receptor, partial [candidate division WOR-3 bacterium]